MTPLMITATVPGLLSLPYGFVHLDGILAAEIIARQGLPAIGIGELVEVDLPVELEPGGRFYLASASIVEWEAQEVLYRQRRFPLGEALARGAGFRRIDTTVGPQKNTRIPVEAGYVKDQRAVFYALGDQARIQDILSTVTALGSQRGSGKGRVAGWAVEPVEPWLGFPVVRDGAPLRTLPADWPGIERGARRTGRIKPPYWWPHGRVEAVFPT